MTNREVEAALTRGRLQARAAFATVKGLDYTISDSYELTATLLELYTNDGLAHATHSPAKFEQMLPPQHTFATLIEML